MVEMKRNPTAVKDRNNFSLIWIGFIVLLLILSLIDISFLLSYKTKATSEALKNALIDKLIKVFIWNQIKMYLCFVLVGFGFFFPSEKRVKMMILILFILFTTTSYWIRFQ